MAIERIVFKSEVHDPREREFLHGVYGWLVGILNGGGYEAEREVEKEPLTFFGNHVFTFASVLKPPGVVAGELQLQFVDADNRIQLFVDDMLASPGPGSEVDDVTAKALEWTRQVLCSPRISEEVSANVPAESHPLAVN